jgi:hypothetical protein
VEDVIWPNRDPNAQRSSIEGGAPETFRISCLSTSALVFKAEWCSCETMVRDEAAVEVMCGV